MTLFSTASKKLLNSHAHAREAGLKQSLENFDAALGNISNAEIQHLNNLAVISVPRNIAAKPLSELADAFPDMNLVANGASSNHAALAAFRTCAASSINKRCIAASTLEIGPNLRFLAKNGTHFSHYCSPNITARDSARACMAAVSFRHETPNSDIVQNRLRLIWSDERVICGSRADDCSHQASTIVAINSLQDSSPFELGQLMRAHGATVAHLTLNLPIPMLLTNAAEYYDTATDSLWRREDGRFNQYPSGGGACYSHNEEQLLSWIGDWSGSGLFAEVHTSLGTCYQLVVARAHQGVQEVCHFDFPAALSKFVLIHSPIAAGADSFLTSRYHFENLVATLATVPAGIDVFQVGKQRVRALRPAIVVGTARETERWDIPTGREPEVVLAAYAYMQKETLRVARSRDFVEREISEYKTRLRRETHEASDSVLSSFYRKLLGERSVSSDFSLLDMVDSLYRSTSLLPTGPEDTQKLNVTATNVVQAAHIDATEERANLPAPALRRPARDAPEEDDEDFHDAEERPADPFVEGPAQIAPLPPRPNRPAPVRYDNAVPMGRVAPQGFERASIFALPATQVNPNVAHLHADLVANAEAAIQGEHGRLRELHANVLHALTWTENAAPRLHIEGVPGSGKSRAMLSMMESGDVLVVPTRELRAKWLNALRRRNLQVAVILADAAILDERINDRVPILWIDEVYRLPLVFVKHLSSRTPLTVTAGDWYQRLYHGFWGQPFNVGFTHTPHQMVLATTHRNTPDIVAFLRAARCTQPGAVSVLEGAQLNAPQDPAGRTIHLTAHNRNLRIAPNCVTIDSAQGMEAPNVVLHVFPTDVPLLQMHGALAVAVTRQLTSLRVVAYGIIPDLIIRGQRVVLPVHEQLNDLGGAMPRRARRAPNPFPVQDASSGSERSHGGEPVGSYEAYLAHPSDLTHDLSSYDTREELPEEVNRRILKYDTHYDVALPYTPAPYVTRETVSVPLYHLAPGINSQPEASEHRDRAFSKPASNTGYSSEIPDVQLQMDYPLLDDAAYNWLPGRNLEAMQSIFDRYLGEPHTIISDAMPVAKHMLDVFVRTFLKPECIVPARLASDCVADWVRSREPRKFHSLLRDIESSGAAFEFVAKFFVKAQVKPKFGAYARDPHLETGQGIMGNSQSLNLSSCPLTVEAFRNLQNLSRDNVVWFTGFAPSELDGHIRRVGGDLHEDYTCTDIKQQDSHHSAPHRLFGAMLLGLLTGQPEMADHYLASRVFRSVSSYANAMRFTVAERLFSGEAFTIFLNTTTAAVENAIHFALPDNQFYMGIGDDSAFEGHRLQMPTAVELNVGIKIEYMKRLDFCNRVWTNMRRSLPDPIRMVAKHLKRTNARHLAPDLYRALLDQNFVPDEAEIPILISHFSAKHKIDMHDVLTIIDYAVLLRREDIFCDGLPEGPKPAVHRPVLLGLDGLPRTYHGLDVVAESRRDDCVPAALSVMFSVDYNLARAELWSTMTAEERVMMSTSNSSSPHVSAFFVPLRCVRAFVSKRGYSLLGEGRTTKQPFRHGLAVVVSNGHCFVVRSKKLASEAFIVPDDPGRLGWYAQDGSRLVGSWDLYEALLRRGARKAAGLTISSVQHHDSFWSAMVFLFLARLYTIPRPNWDDYAREDAFFDSFLDAGLQQCGFFCGMLYALTGEIFLFLLALFLALPLVMAHFFFPRHFMFTAFAVACFVSLSSFAFSPRAIVSGLGAFFHVDNVHLWRHVVPLVYAILVTTRHFKSVSSIAVALVALMSCGSILRDSLAIIAMGHSLHVLAPVLNKAARRYLVLAPIFSSTLQVHIYRSLQLPSLIVVASITYVSHGALAPVALAGLLTYYTHTLKVSRPPRLGQMLIAILLATAAFDVHHIRRSLHQSVVVGSPACIAAIVEHNPRAVVLCHPDKSDLNTREAFDAARRLRGGVHVRQPWHDFVDVIKSRPEWPTLEKGLKTVRRLTAVVQPIKAHSPRVLFAGFQRHFRPSIIATSAQTLFHSGLARLSLRHLRFSPASRSAPWMVVSDVIARARLRRSQPAHSTPGHITPETVQRTPGVCSPGNLLTEDGYMPFYIYPRRAAERPYRMPDWALRHEHDVAPSVPHTKDPISRRQPPRTPGTLLRNRPDQCGTRRKLYSPFPMYSFLFVLADFILSLIWAICFCCCFCFYPMLDEEDDPNPPSPPPIIGLLIDSEIFEEIATHVTSEGTPAPSDGSSVTSSDDDRDDFPGSLDTRRMTPRTDDAPGSGVASPIVASSPAVDSSLFDAFGRATGLELEHRVRMAVGRVLAMRSQGYTLEHAQHEAQGMVGHVTPRALATLREAVRVAWFEAPEAAAAHAMVAVAGSPALVARATAQAFYLRGESLADLMAWASDFANQLSIPRVHLLTAVSEEWEVLLVGPLTPAMATPRDVAGPSAPSSTRFTSDDAVSLSDSEASNDVGSSAPASPSLSRHSDLPAPDPLDDSDDDAGSFASNDTDNTAAQEYFYEGPARNDFALTLEDADASELQDADCNGHALVRAYAHNGILVLEGHRDYDIVFYAHDVIADRYFVRSDLRSMLLPFPPSRIDFGVANPDSPNEPITDHHPLWNRLRSQEHRALFPDAPHTSMISALSWSESDDDFIPQDAQRVFDAESERIEQEITAARGGYRPARHLPLLARPQILRREAPIVDEGETFEVWAANYIRRRRREGARFHTYELEVREGAAVRFPDEPQGSTMSMTIMLIAEDLEENDPIQRALTTEAVTEIPPLEPETPIVRPPLFPLESQILEDEAHIARDII
uniref:RNA-dependent RNA polymerase n=1 Tax=Rhizoctonia cerealis alphavirus-like virus TaxID=3068663 RepID=A0AA51BSD7_9VIRU|nr:MAG: RNA-dependent RNA polymerase [Rhizoctonia cerealis alphavirus-like virus]